MLCGGLSVYETALLSVSCPLLLSRADGNGGPLVHTVALGALVVAMHVDTCSPTNPLSSQCILDSDVHLTDAFEVSNTPNALFDNINDVISTCLNMLQPSHTSLPLILEVLAECHNHTDM